MARLPALSSLEPRRFSIRPPRPLWIGLATAVLSLAAVGFHVGLPIYRQHLVIRDVERLGGRVVTLPRGPDWLRDRIGSQRMKLFDAVVAIHLRDSQATDELLGRLRWLPGLESLALSHTDVSDAGLAQLKGLRNLKRLWLANTHVTDAGLVHVSGLTGLEELWLENTRVTDTGLDHLKRLTTLKGLWLDNSQVTHAGVAELQRALPGTTIGALLMNP